MKKKLFIIAIAILACFFIYKETISNKTLYIQSENNTVIIRNLKEKDTIKLSYLQSLYKTTQSEVFHIEKNSLILDKMIFGDLNSLYYYDEQDLNYYIENEKIHLVDINKGFKEIPIRANYSQTHFLEIYKDNDLFKEVDISSIFKNGEILKIGITTNLKSIFMKQKILK